MNARAKKIFFAIICGCTASLANPTPLSQDIQPGTQKTAPPNGVVELLTRLKYAIDLCLIDNQTSLENLMGFKFYNSGGTKEDYAEYDGAHKSINGSWGAWWQPGRMRFISQNSIPPKISDFIRFSEGVEYMGHHRA